MSAAVAVLPRVWACSNAIHLVPRAGAPNLAPAVGAPSARKGPHSLRLLASAAAAQPAPATYPKLDLPMPRRAMPEMAFYRKYTEGLLRRYTVLSMESGRVPSLLNREMFRGKVTSCKVRGFDDVVIFVHDVSRCLDQLEWGQQHLIRRIALEEYTQEETAAMHGLSLRTVVRRYAEALDRLTRILLDKKLLEPLGTLPKG